MSRESDPREWRRFAEIDRRAARHLLEAGDYEACAFHCQQAIEKLLKAIIVKQTTQKPVHTHDLRALLEELKDIEVSPEIASLVSNIDIYYIGTRYPLDVADPNIFKKPLAESAVGQADKVFEWFLAQINFGAE